MKKLIIAGAIAVMTLAGTTSCNGSSTADNNLNDSLSTMLGQMQGGQLNLSFASLTEDQRDGMEKSQILAGIKAILLADTANHGYMNGLTIGMNMQSGFAQLEAQGVKIDRKKFYDAFVSYFNGDTISQTELLSLQAQFEPLMQKAQQAGMAEMQAKMEADRKAREESPEAKKNIADGKKYVDDAKAKDANIKTTASGLSYKVETEGTGDSPKMSDQVQVKYTGKHINGEVFDSSEGEAVTFPVGGVVPGFGEALQLMKKGGKMTIYIPGNLAYGVDGVPGKIGPMETLVFEVELVDIAGN